MLLIGGADEFVIGGVHQIPDVTDHGSDLVHVCLRAHACCDCLLLDLLSVLICARHKADIIALFSLETRDRVRQYDLVGVADMRLAGCIGDRCRDIIWFLFGCFSHKLCPPHTGCCLLTERPPCSVRRILIYRNGYSPCRGTVSVDFTTLYRILKYISSDIILADISHLAVFLVSYGQLQGVLAEVVDEGIDNAGNDLILGRLIVTPFRRGEHQAAHRRPSHRRTDTPQLSLIAPLRIIASIRLTPRCTPRPRQSPGLRRRVQPCR